MWWIKGRVRCKYREIRAGSRSNFKPNDKKGWDGYKYVFLPFVRSGEMEDFHSDFVNLE